MNSSLKTSWEGFVMNQTRRSLIMTAAVIGMLFFMASPALSAAPQPPFFGPQNLPNTIPGEVDVSGGADVYPTGTPGAASINIVIQSPWSSCGVISFTAEKTGSIPGKYDQFSSLGRVFTLDIKDADNYYIGGHYTTTGVDNGTLTLEKSAGSTTYNQVRLQGTTGSGPVNTVLSLVQQNGTIGVANLASVAGAVSTCGSANPNSQIWLPMGTGSNGQPTVILDINGDGVPDSDFTEGPPASGTAPPPIPTLNEWGLIVLILLLLALGLRFARKHEPLSPA
jgi:IPTL-CTERM motif